MKEINGYWVDEKNNKWSIDKFTKNEADLCSKTLIEYGFGGDELTNSRMYEVEYTTGSKGQMQGYEPWGGQETDNQFTPAQTGKEAIENIIYWLEERINENGSEVKIIWDEEDVSSTIIEVYGEDEDEDDEYKVVEGYLWFKAHVEQSDGSWVTEEEYKESWDDEEYEYFNIQNR